MIKGMVPEDHRQTCNRRPLPCEGIWKPEREQWLALAAHLGWQQCPLLCPANGLLWIKLWLFESPACHTGRPRHALRHKHYRFAHSQKREKSDQRACLHNSPTPKKADTDASACPSSLCPARHPWGVTPLETGLQLFTGNLAHCILMNCQSHPHHRQLMPCHHEQDTSLGSRGQRLQPNDDSPSHDITQDMSS